MKGRTVSDNIGEFTFVETTGTSVVDYIMVISPDIKHVRDMIVKSTSCPTHSALHLTLVCNLMKHNSPVNQEPRIIFKQSNVMNFPERFQSNLTYCKSNLSYESFKNCWFQSALECKMVQQEGSKKFSKPWFDHDCIRQKIFLAKALKAAKRSRWNLKERSEYLEAKKDYKFLLKEKSKSHWKGQIEKLNLVSSPIQFCSQLYEKSTVVFFRVTTYKRM